MLIRSLALERGEGKTVPLRNSLLGDAKHFDKLMQGCLFQNVSAAEFRCGGELLMRASDD